LILNGQQTARADASWESPTSAIFPHVPFVLLCAVAWRDSHALLVGPGSIQMCDKPSLDCFDPFTARFVRAKVNQLIGRYGFTESDREDLTQDFVLNLLERAKSFDPTIASWEAFVVVTCQNHYSTIVEHRTAQMRSRDREAGSLNATPRGGKRADIGSTMAESQQDLRTGRRTRSHEDAFGLIHDLAVIEAQLPHRIRELFRMIKEGVSKRAAARALGISQGELYEIHRRYRVRFEKEGMRDYLR
jgi:RNA polymerase sigma-70 factor (ECF subfamily)